MSNTSNHLVGLLPSPSDSATTIGEGSTSGVKSCNRLVTTHQTNNSTEKEIAALMSRATLLRDARAKAMWRHRMDKVVSRFSLRLQPHP